VITLEAHGVGKAYVPGQWVFRGLTLRLEAGSAMAIVGPNGAGKTTLIKLLCGLAVPTEGEVRVRIGRRWYRPQECLWWGIGVVGPFLRLYEEFTPWELFQLSASLRGGRWDRQFAQWIAQELGLSSALHRQIAELSSGMQQRVRIALAFLHRPMLLAVDEVTATLDTGGIAAVERVVRWHCARGGILFAATNAEHEQRWCTRLLELPSLTERTLSSCCG